MNKGRYHSTVKRRRRTIGGGTKITYRPPMTDEVIDCAGILSKTLGGVLGIIGIVGMDLYKATKEDAKIKEDKTKEIDKDAKIAELEAEIERLKKQSH